MPRKRVGICVYCGRKKRLTREHIPPKNLFPKPRPSNLITVPCCADCNHAAAKDDEYFRMAVTMKDGVGRHPEARRSWQTVHRSLQRAPASGLRVSLIKSLRPVLLQSRGGVLLGQRAGYEVDLTRLNRVVSRIVRGLFFHETGSALPQTHDSVGLIESLADAEETTLVELAEVLAPLQPRPATQIGGGVFAYRYLLADDDPFCSAWAMSFYEWLPAMGFTLPIGQVLSNVVDPELE